MRVGVVKRGKYGERLIETIKQRTGFEVVLAEIPEHLPDFIEDPVEFLKDLFLDLRIFRSDLLILYTFHPDITPAIVRMAGELGVKAVIIPGGMARAGSIGELEALAAEYDMHIEVDEICCTLEKCGVPAVDQFARILGRPKFDLKTKDGKITSVEVVRGSPCGGTWHVARGLVGKTIDEAPALAGLLCQQYPCRAVRGTPGGIHTSADLHRHAVLEAIGFPTELEIPVQSRPIKIERRG